MAVSKNNTKSIDRFDFLKSDPMMNDFYEAYVVRKEVPDRQEVYINLRFFAAMTIASKRLEISDVGDIMGRRLDQYVLLLRMLGYRVGASFSHRQDFGIQRILEWVFGGLNLD